MVTSLRETFITFSLIAVFIFSSISFIVTMQQDNNADNTILENNVINRTFVNLETNLEQFETNTSTQRESVEADIPERGFGSLLIFSIVPAFWAFVSLVFGVYNIMIILPASILGIPLVVINVLSSILTITLILLLWRAVRVGS